MQFQFDALGEHGILCGTEFKDYPLFDDAPNEFDFLGWVANIAIGVVIAIVCIGLSIATGGLAGAALAGAAMGTLAVTATIAIEDAQDGEVRNPLVAVGQIALGAIAGAAVGATGAYIMPHGVATMSTFVKFGMLSGTTMRVATSNAMEHMDTLDRLWYTFNPTRVLTDGLLGGIFGGVSNYYKLGTAFPSQEMVSAYNAQQAAIYGIGTNQGKGGGKEKPPTGKVPPKTTSRPSWRQSEVDVGKMNPDYRPQVSFLNGKEVPYGTPGSSRPDYYKIGSSLEVKNYNVTTDSGRESLIRVVSEQVKQRIINLPKDTTQTIIIDVRGQQVASSTLKQLRDSILGSCGSDSGVLIQFMK